MTVRAWFTISAIALLAMSFAAYLRLTTPAPPPEILARTSHARLHGYLASACWPRRGGAIRCERHRAGRVLGPALSGHETVLLTAYPVGPKRGSIEISRGGRVVLRSPWRRSLALGLHPGSYSMRVEARYTQRTYVSWVFPFTVTRSGD